MRIMKRIVYALSAAAWTVSAADLPITETEPVIVTATRFEQKRDAAPIGVSVISREAIERSTATSVVELLSHQAGIQVRDSTGGPDPQIDMRGFGQTGDLNTTVLIDGQRFNDIDTSTIKWSAIPLAAVERIEILPGSGAVLYGSGATGGVINVITRQPRAGERTAEAFAGAGGYQTADLQGALTLASETVGIRAHAADYRSDNYRDNNRLMQRNLLADVRTLGREGNVYVKIGVDQQNLRNPGQRTLEELARDRRGTSTPLDFSSRDGARADIGGMFRLGAAELAANLAYRTQQTKAYFSAFSSEVDNDTHSVAFSPRIRLPHQLGGLKHILVSGIDIEEGSLDRNVTGAFFAGRSKAKQQKQGIYLQNSVTLNDRLLLTLGARVQRADTILDDPGALPAPLEKKHSVNASEAVLRYRATPALAAYGKAGRSFRFASVEEINFTGPAILEPQTSLDREIGVEYRSAAARLRAALYRMDLENEIAFNPMLFDNINLAPTRREGLEIESRLRAGESMELFANYAHVRARFRSGVYATVDLSGNDVPLVPRNTLTAGGSWQAGVKARIVATVHYVGEQRMLNDEANTLAAKIPAYFTFDLKYARETGGWRLAAGVKNLLDKKYYTQGGVNFMGVVRVFPAPERTVFASAQYTFK